MVFKKQSSFWPPLFLSILVNHRHLQARGPAPQLSECTNTTETRCVRHHQLHLRAPRIYCTLKSSAKRQKIEIYIEITYNIYIYTYVNDIINIISSMRLFARLLALTIQHPAWPSRWFQRLGCHLAGGWQKSWAWKLHAQTITIHNRHNPTPISQKAAKHLHKPCCNAWRTRSTTRSKATSSVCRCLEKWK